MVLKLQDVAKLKEYIREKYNQELHLHDTCSGQYFTFDTKIKGIDKDIKNYLKKIGKTAIFNDDTSFTAE